MANSTATISIEAQPSVDDILHIRIVNGATTVQNIEIIFKATRENIGECAIGLSIAQTTNNLINAIQTDFNAGLLFGILVAVSGDEFVITAFNPAHEFVLVTNDADPNVLVVINNDATATFTIDSVTAAEAVVGSACFDVQLTVTASQQADNITSPVSQVVGANPFIFETERNYNAVPITMVLGSQTATQWVKMPNLLAEYFTFNVVIAADGTGTITASAEAGLYTTADTNILDLVTLEYSLDNVTWYSANSFSGLPADDYTLYIRDNLGCSISHDFTVGAFTPNLTDFAALAEISELNAMAFKCVETVDGCSTHRNIKNTLSYEEQTAINNRRFKQIWQQCDALIRTQIRSSYETITAKLFNCAGEVSDLTVTKKTDNMNHNDIRDAKIYRGSGSQIWLYFTTGNIYNPDAPAEVIDTYNLAGNLPSFTNVGDWIFVEGHGWTQIVDQFTGGIGAGGFGTRIKTAIEDVDNFFANNSTVKVTSVYNKVDYERYEIALDISALLGDYYVEVYFTDSTFDAKTQKGEWFEITDEYCIPHHVIEWYNSKNNNLLYSTGIQFKLRLPYVINLTYTPSSEQELYVTDTKTILLENTAREFYEMTLHPLPMIMARKVALALMHDRLQVDGITYVLSGEPDIQRMGSTNLYRVKAQLIRSDYVFENQTGLTLQEIALPSGTPLTIDGAGSGFLLAN